MPSLNYKFLQTLETNELNNYTNFVETGTYMGQTIFAMEPYFDKLFTIEINETFHENVKNKYHGDKINFYLGDSSEKLSDVIKNIDGNTIFFLDGHWSGGRTGCGVKKVPLYEELEIIIKDFKYDCIIIVDDFRLFGKKYWQDINLENVNKIVSMRMEKSYMLPSKHAEKDRLILHIRKID